MNYKTRMLDEMLELQLKIFKLENYLEDKIEDPNNLSLEERQLNAMREYLSILHERMFEILRDDISISVMKE